MNQSYITWSTDTKSYCELNSGSETYSGLTTNIYRILPLHYRNVNQNSTMQNTHVSTQQSTSDLSIATERNSANDLTIRNDMSQTNTQELKATRITSSNIFCHGYGLIPKYAMQDSHLSLTAKAIYSYLCALSGSGKTAFPSVTKICSALNIGKDAYYNNRKKLIEAGYITVEQRHNGRNFTSNLYTLNPYPAHLLTQRGNEKEKHAAKAVRESGLRNAGYGLLPRSVMTNPYLNAKTKGLYAYFASFAGTGNTAFPSLKRILIDLNISEPTYYKCLNQLKKNGLLTVHQCKKNARFDRNTYTLSDEIYYDQVQEKNIPNHNTQTDQKPSSEKKIIKSPLSKEDTIQNHAIESISPNTTEKKQDLATKKNQQPNESKQKPFSRIITKKTKINFSDEKKPDTIINNLRNNNNPSIIYQSIYIPNTQIRSTQKEEYIEELKDAVGYEDIPIMYPKTNMTIIDSILEMIASIVCFGTDPMIKIGKSNYPREQVRRRYLSLTSEHLQYVIECVEKQKHHIKNIRSYYLVSLWNAPDTIELYYHRRVAEDLGYMDYN